MSSTSGIPDISLDQQSRPQVATLGWALRRAALGLAMMLVIVMLGAWLLYASIDPDEAAAGGAVPAAAAATPR